MVAGHTQYSDDFQCERGKTALAVCPLAVCFPGIAKRIRGVFAVRFHDSFAVFRFGEVAAMGC